MLLPIDLTSIIAIVMGMLVVLIPVAGLTTRFALKPIVEAIARFRETQTSTREISLIEKRLALLEQQMINVEGTLERIGDEAEFQRKLASPQR